MNLNEKGARSFDKYIFWSFNFKNNINYTILVSQIFLKFNFNIKFIFVTF